MLSIDKTIQKVLFLPKLQVFIYYIEFQPVDAAILDLSILSHIDIFMLGMQQIWIQNIELLLETLYNIN